MHILTDFPLLITITDQVHLRLFIHNMQFIAEKSSDPNLGRFKKTCIRKQAIMWLRQILIHDIKLRFFYLCLPFPQGVDNKVFNGGGKVHFTPRLKRNPRIPVHFTRHQNPLYIGPPHRNHAIVPDTLHESVVEVTGGK